jgi:5S rRNA maturation endonuclease (ribonuclease M5)
MTVMKKNEFPEIAELLASQAETLISYLNLNGVYENNVFRTGDVTGAPGQSMVINIKDHGKYTAGTFYDFASEDHGDLIDLILLNRGHGNKAAALKEAKEFLGINDDNNYKSASKKVAKKKTAVIERPAKKILQDASNENVNRHHNILINNPVALTYLKDRGINLETVSKFKLGLSTGYTNKKGIHRENFLMYPLVDSDGRFKKKFGYIGIPDVSIASDSSLSPFMATGGGTFAYFNQALTYERRVLILVEGHKDLWALDNFIKGTPYETEWLIATPCNGVLSTGSIPEIHDEKFLSYFKKIYCIYDNDEAGDRGANKLIEIIPSLPLYRVKVKNHEDKTGADITDFIKRGAAKFELDELMRSATDMRTQKKMSAEEALDLGKTSSGKYNYNPFDPNISFHNGMLHYPMIMHLVGIDEESGEKYEMQSVGVIRSDRKELTLRQSRLPKGVDRSKAILRLSDGSIISEEPRPNEYATWEYSAACEWMSGEYDIPSAESLYSRIKMHLASYVSLPEPADYTILTLAIMASYIQPIFDAVPYILLHGAKGSGKSELGEAIARVGANANQISAMSAATLSRETDKTGGIVILDDVEDIGNQGKTSAIRLNLEQYLKVGYKKSTGIRKLQEKTASGGFKTLHLNQFGIKVMGNTGGVLDEPLLQRMYVVKTKALQKDSTFKKVHLPPDVLHRLRQDLHAWSFEYVSELNSIYQAQYAHSTNREEEIAAPLLVIAAHTRSDEIKSELAEAMRIQDIRRINNESPETLLEEACRAIAAQGYQDVLVKHVQLEMKILIDPLEGRDSKFDIVDWDRLEWVTKTLQNMDIAEVKKNGSTKQRMMLNGQKHSVLRFSNSFIEQARRSLVKPAPARTDARSFCMNQTCMNCPYINECDMTKRNNLNNKDIAK